jgi:hypothetical protein
VVDYVSNQPQIHAARATKAKLERIDPRPS